jgi:hypothetical protein
MGSGLLSPCKSHQAGKERIRTTEDGRRRSERRKERICSAFPRLSFRPRSSERSKTGVFADRAACVHASAEGGVRGERPPAPRRGGRVRGARRACEPMESSRLGDESNQVERAISTGQLHTLLRFHIRPINVVVFHGSSGRTCFEAGFPLRCLQRLSIPYIATLHRRWRDDRSTRDTFTPVLSY